MTKTLGHRFAHALGAGCALMALIAAAECPAQPPAAPRSVAKAPAVPKAPRIPHVVIAIPGVLFQEIPPNDQKFYPVSNEQPLTIEGKVYVPSPYWRSLVNILRKSQGIRVSFVSTISDSFVPWLSQQGIQNVEPLFSPGDALDSLTEKASDLIVIADTPASVPAILRAHVLSLPAQYLPYADWETQKNFQDEFKKRDPKAYARGAARFAPSEKALEIDHNRNARLLDVLSTTLFSPPAGGSLSVLARAKLATKSADASSLDGQEIAVYGRSLDAFAVSNPKALEMARTELTQGCQALISCTGKLRQNLGNLGGGLTQVLDWMEREIAIDLRLAEQNIGEISRAENQRAQTTKRLLIQTSQQIKEDLNRLNQLCESRLAAWSRNSASTRLPPAEVKTFADLLGNQVQKFSANSHDLVLASAPGGQNLEKTGIRSVVLWSLAADGQDVRYFATQGIDLRATIRRALTSAPQTPAVSTPAAHYVHAYQALMSEFAAKQFHPKTPRSVSQEAITKSSASLVECLKEATPKASTPPKSLPPPEVQITARMDCLSKEVLRGRNDLLTLALQDRFVRFTELYDGLPWIEKIPNAVASNHLYGPAQILTSALLPTLKKEVDAAFGPELAGEPNRAFREKAFRNLLLDPVDCPLDRYLKQSVGGSFGSAEIFSLTQIEAAMPACTAALKTAAQAKRVDLIAELQIEAVRKELREDAELAKTFPTSAERDTYANQMSRELYGICFLKGLEARGIPARTEVDAACRIPLKKAVRLRTLLADASKRLLGSPEVSALLKSQIPALRNLIVDQVVGKTYSPCMTQLATTTASADEAIDDSACVARVAEEIKTSAAKGFVDLGALPLLIRDLAADTRELTRPVYFYNHRRRQYLVEHGLPASGPVPLNHPGAIKYAKEWADAFWNWRGPSSDGGVVGWGLYGAVDPVSTSEYGEVIVRLKLPTGTRYLDLRRSGSELSLASDTCKVLAPFCGWHPSACPSNSHFTLKKNALTQTAACHALLTQAFRAVRIGAMIYPYGGQKPENCRNREGPAAVVVDIPFNEETVQVFVPEAGDLNKAPEKLAAYTQLNSVAKSVGSPIWRTVPSTQDVSAFHRESTFSCGTYLEDNRK